MWLCWQTWPSTKLASIQVQLAFFENFQAELERHMEGTLLGW
jgi:hypothetical protein